MLVVIDTDDIGSHKSNYNTTTTTTGLVKKDNFFLFKKTSARVHNFIDDKC